MEQRTTSHPDPDVARLTAPPTSVVGDELDRLGRRSQAMEHTERPLVDRRRPCVPAGLVAEALAAAEQKLGLDSIVQEGLERGEKEARPYDRYGVL